jgi:hypothetical protein
VLEFSAVGDLEVEMRSLLGLVVLVAAGCASETSISGGEDAFGVDNPAQLDTQKQEDRIVQVTTPQVDVLFAIDNSCSMAEEQAALTDNFDLFMQFFLQSGLDYHVGVISTDMADPQHQGKLRESRGLRFIDSETEDPTDVFRSMAQMGTSGSGDERGRESIYEAVERKKNGFNKDFIRERGSLHIVIISDEDDHSGTNPIGRNEFAEYLLDLKPNPDNVSFSSIVHPESFSNGGVFGDEEPGAEYLWITRSVGGIEWDIRTEDWGTVLELLGVQASGLKREFFLSQLPVEGSIEVTVLYEGVVFGFTEGDQWVYDPSRNSVRFLEYVPEALAEVYVTYDVLASFQDSEIDSF